MLSQDHVVASVVNKDPVKPMNRIFWQSVIQPSWDAVLIFSSPKEVISDSYSIHPNPPCPKEVEQNIILHHS